MSGTAPPCWTARQNSAVADVPADVGTSGAKAREGVGGGVEERGHNDVVGASELRQQLRQCLLVRCDHRRGLLDVEVEDHAGELLEHLAQGGDAEARVLGRPTPVGVVGLGAVGRHVGARE